MTNYEKAKYLLKNGVAREHYTFKKSGYIIIDLGGEYVGYISPFCKCVEVSSGGIHIGYGNIDLDKMMVLDNSNRHRYDRPIKKWAVEK